MNIRLGRSGIEARIAISGCECAPVKLELLFEPGGRYACDSIELRAQPGDCMVQKCDLSQYRYDDHS